jgi:uncharacterized iron-regulated protein
LNTSDSPAAFSRHTLNQLARRAGWLALASLLAACQQLGPLAAGSLQQQGTRLVLDRPLLDFYDSAFVLTGTSGSDPPAPRPVSIEALADALGGYDVVFYGESHRHAGVHLQQQRLLRELHQRQPGLILSMEQFERDVQPVIDDYLAGRVGEITLVDQARAWDNYRTSYRPLVLYAKDHGLGVLAAEAPTWAIACIGQLGPEVLARFTAQERGWVAAQLHLGPSLYRDRYMAFQSGSATHGGGPAAAPTPQALLRAERSYAAQAARDDTMAESIARALQQHPGHRVLHLNGSFHSAGFLGTVERLKLRLPGVKVAVIEPVEIVDSRHPAFEASALQTATALQLIAANPPGFAPGEDQGEWVRKIMAQRQANACRYQPAASGPAATP